MTQANVRLMVGLGEIVIIKTIMLDLVEKKGCNRKILSGTKR